MILKRATSVERGYDSKWQAARREFLKANPYCVKHLERGERVAATVVDHIKPHRRDWSVFWDRNNWQPLCKLHHDSLKQKIEFFKRRSRSTVRQLLTFVQETFSSITTA